MKKIILFLIISTFTFNLLAKPLYNKPNYKNNIINLSSINMLQNFLGCNNLFNIITNQINERNNHVNECIFNKSNCLNNYNRFQDCNYNLLQNLVGVSCETLRQYYVRSCNVFSGVNINLIRNINCDTYGIGDGRDICINYFDYNDRQCQRTIDLHQNIREICNSY